MLCLKSTSSIVTTISKHCQLPGIITLLKEMENIYDSIRSSPLQMWHIIDSPGDTTYCPLAIERDSSDLTCTELDGKIGALWFHSHWCDKTKMQAML